MERVELHTATGVVRMRAWATGASASSKHRRVEVGKVGNRYYAWHTGKGAAYVFATERQACERADTWISTGEWRPTPARFGPDGKPADGGMWWRQGGDWAAGEPPTD